MNNIKTVDDMVNQEVIYNVNEVMDFIYKQDSDCVIDEWVNLFDDDGAMADILEYWLVSEWLADKLIEQGEAVAKDIHGMIVWGRTCSGQSISMDSVINYIYGGMML